MSIGSVSSSSPVQALSKPMPVEATEATRNGQDISNDGDSDDATSASAPTRAPQPTTNNLGQLIGKNVNVTA